MVMGKRPDVARSSWPVAATDMAGLVGQIGISMLQVPFRRPWSGEGSVARNVAVAVTRQTVRTFMGYSTSLPIEQFRSIEVILDDLCTVVMPPAVRAWNVSHGHGEVAGVAGEWFRPRSDRSGGTILYLHGGGYVGTSPKMYSVFIAQLARRTGCDVFVPDLRLAPEFPFPANLDDATAAGYGLIDDGVDPQNMFIAGDSSGGGLVTSVVHARIQEAHPRIAGVLLFSPEVNLRLDCPSVRDNADRDILPWNIPTSSYLNGIDPGSTQVSAISDDLTGWPATFVSFGSDEMFRDAIRRFCTHLHDAEIDPVVVLEEPGMFHVFPILLPWTDAARRTMVAAGAFVRARLDELRGAEDSAGDDGDGVVELEGVVSHTLDPSV